MAADERRKSLHGALIIFSAVSDESLHGYQITHAEVLNGLRYAANYLLKCIDEVGPLN